MSSNESDSKGTPVPTYEMDWRTWDAWDIKWSIPQDRWVVVPRPCKHPKPEDYGPGIVSHTQIDYKFGSFIGFSDNRKKDAEIMADRQTVIYRALQLAKFFTAEGLSIHFIYTWSVWQAYCSKNNMLPTDPLPDLETITKNIIGDPQYCVYDSWPEVDMGRIHQLPKSIIPNLHT